MAFSYHPYIYAFFVNQTRITLALPSGSEEVAHVMPSNQGARQPLRMLFFCRASRYHCPPRNSVMPLITRERRKEQRN
jgi:hypothetical protein